MKRRILFWVLVAANIYLAVDIYNFIATRRAMLTPSDGYFSGAQTADLVVVEFLDYSCANCKYAHPVLKRAMESDGKILYIPRPVPSASAAASKYVEFVYAAGLQGKFMPAHEALIAETRPLDETIKKEIAGKIGVDIDKINKNASSKDVTENIKQNRIMLAYFYRPQLPIYVVGGRLIYAPKAPPTESDFKNVFDEARQMFHISPSASQPETPRRTQ